MELIFYPKKLLPEIPVDKIKYLLQTRADVPNQSIYTSHDELQAAAIPNGTILLTADKNFGMVLLFIKDLLSAGEEKKFKSLGAEKEKLNASIDLEYRKLRSDASEAGVQFLAPFPPIQAS